MSCNKPKKEIACRKSEHRGKKKEWNRTLLDPSLCIPSGPLRLPQNYWQNVLLFWEEKRKVKEGKGRAQANSKRSIITKSCAFVSSKLACLFFFPNTKSAEWEARWFICTHLSIILWRAPISPPWFCLRQNPFRSLWELCLKKPQHEAGDSQGPLAHCEIMHTACPWKSTMLPTSFSVSAPIHLFVSFSDCILS